MLNIGRGWLVPVTMLNIWRRRRRDHPQPSVLKKKRGKPSLPTMADFAQLLVAHAHTLPPLRATFGSHGTCTNTLVRKKRRENPDMRRTYFRTRSGQGRFWARDFRLRSITWLTSLPGPQWAGYCVTLPSTWRVSSGHVTSGCSTSLHHRKYGLSCCHILLS
jgi:hypothetical protein